MNNVNTFYEGERIPALHDVNLKIYRGEYILILGPNGAGKTTLLETILGLLKVKNGIIEIFGHPITNAKDDLRRKIGYVIQNFEMDPNQPFLVKDIVMIGRVARRGSGRPPNEQDWLAVKESLKVVGMESFMNRPIGRLSGGQQQKVLIAQALCKQPEILLLDEPFANLDLDSQEEIMRLLSYLKSIGITILLVSHGIKIPPKVDRIIMIDRGWIDVDDSLEKAHENLLFKKYIVMEQAMKNWETLGNGA
ncbi:MAG: metal ABC transporter ATP-binding protein [Promethearchaeota archaeon]